jgi:hypothetical protein
MNKIIIETGELRFTAVLNESATSERIIEALPFKGKAIIWGDEIYFTIPVQLEQAGDARADVAIGDLGYWPPGSAFCIFFGPTPASTGDKPRAYSPVNVFGKIEGDTSQLKEVADGAIVKVSML